MSSPSKVSRPPAVRDEAGDGLESRRLAGAVGADQGHELALTNFERKLADRGDLAVAAGQALNLQHVRAFRRDRRG